MNNETLVLTFPQSSIIWENGHYIQIDTKLTKEEFLMALMKSMDGPIAVKEREESNDKH